MREEGKQPQLPDDREYRKLFGLDIYLTPVFVISSNRHPRLCHWGTRVSGRRDKTVCRCPRLAHDEP